MYVFWFMNRIRNNLTSKFVMRFNFCNLIFENFFNVLKILIVQKSHVVSQSQWNFILHFKILNKIKD